MCTKHGPGAFVSSFLQMGLGHTPTCLDAFCIETNHTTPKEGFAGHTTDNFSEPLLKTSWRCVSKMVTMPKYCSSLAAVICVWNETLKKYRRSND